MPTLRVALADDHPVVREGLKAILRTQAEFEVVGEAENGPHAVALVTAAQSDVLILGLSLPSTVDRVRQADPHGRILALSAHADRGHAQAVLAAGANGYALKQSPTAELLRGVRAVAAGQTYLDPAVVLGPEAAGDEATVELSHRELEVLRLIAQGFSNKEIAARLMLSVKTVETYKARSQEKLGLRTRVDLVRYAARNGWLSDL